ncbi:hypothetical protein LINPERHAP2_LOCUS10693, partial [Linum perenne]
LKFCSYKIQLRVADSTGEATFLLLGYSADSIMPITAADLRRSFPADGSGFPPQIDMFRDLTLTFELQQPGRPRPGSFADFRVTRIFDLPASFGSRRSYSRLSKPTLDAPVKANEISRGACMNSPGLGAGSLGFSSPPQTPVAGCSTVNCGYSHKKQWGHIHLPSPPEISAGVLPTPDKADGLPRSFDSAAKHDSTSKRRSSGSTASEMGSPSDSEVEADADSDNEPISKRKARLNVARPSEGEVASDSDNEPISHIQAHLEKTRPRRVRKARKKLDL